MTNKTKMFCPTCFQEWETKSTRKLITCPNCGLRAENKSYVQKEKQNE